MSATYKSEAALVPVRRLLSEADMALEQPQRSLKDTDVPEILGAVGGVGAGVAAGWGILAGGAAAGTSGAAAMTSGLAAAGSIVGGGMLAGVAVVAAPAVVLSVAGYGVLAYRNKMRLRAAKEALLQEALRKNDAIVRNLNARVNSNEQRAEYLKRLVVQLGAVIENLRADLQTA